MPTELFFPIGHGPDAQAQISRAKEVCRACMVRDQCLDYALAGNMHYGVFGGLSEEERRELRRGSHPLLDERWP
jgi:WhiB family redox-sensing transcriptional regulator